MRYQVKFREDALKEWQKLDKVIQQQFAKKLKKCCDNPYIPSAKLRGIKDCYKIKLLMKQKNQLQKICRKQ